MAGGDRKIGRNAGSAQNKSYKAQGRRRKNKIRKLTAYVLKNQNDLQAAQALKAIESNYEY